MSRLKAIFLFIACFALILVLQVQIHNRGGLQLVNVEAAANPTGSYVFSQSANDNLAADQPDKLSIRWYKSQQYEEPKGVALVIHGLNLQPARMAPIISKLTASGIDVLRLSLRGHGENYLHHEGTDVEEARMEAFKNVSYQLWIREAYVAYLQVKERAKLYNAPVFLAAFSLGGLIGLDLFASNPEVHFDRMVLFAPAIKVHGIIYLQRVLSPFPQLVIPSLAPGSYLSNKKGTPIAAYNALFAGLEHFEKNADSKINVSTLILIDKEDEFIPLWGLKKLVKEKNLDQWSFYIVEKAKDVKFGVFHHHIIDEYSTGKDVWAKMMKTVVLHLLGDKQD
jgi:esterase/lipase